MVTPMGDSTNDDSIPALKGDAAVAVEHEGSHIQIIAAAGSGKTEVVSQRVAALIAKGVEPAVIVAFTFTEKAAAELKERIRQRVTARVGQAASDKLGQLRVSTIHAFCFRLLQTFRPEYESYSLIDENQLVALMQREANRISVRKFDARDRLFAGIDAFLRSVDVIENELISPADIPEGDFKDSLKIYYETLARYRVLTFGQQIAENVRILEDPVVHSAATAQIAHLIVDEYQDVNPAQERLIQLLAKPVGSADLVVVGDDDQAIYQWRGSNVANIVTFADRFDNVTQFSLLQNRRSRPDIVSVADAFARTISGRLDKTMSAFRVANGPAVEIALGFDDEQQEAEMLALSILNLHDLGVPFSSMSVLVRGKVAYPKIVDAFAQFSIPVQPGGRTGLFEQDIAAVLGATFSWLTDVDWAASRWVQREKPTLDSLTDDLTRVFRLSGALAAAARAHLVDWKGRVPQEQKDANLVGDVYDFLAALGVKDWDLDDVVVRNRLGTVARFTRLIADYESVVRRARVDIENPGQQVGGVSRGIWYYRNLALLMVNYATGNYDDFEGEEDLDVDAVSLGTVHGAKGLEWPVVFLPSLTDGRFPSSRTGTVQNWLIPRDLFDAGRYEGADGDERRLFYVALTRARDWIGLSSHRKVKKQVRRPSPYLLEAAAVVGTQGMPHGFDVKSIEVADLQITYSELAAYIRCARSYLLRTRLGFQPTVAAELGYGNAVHHLMRVIAERTKAKGSLPSPRDINELIESDFFLPFANKFAHNEMRERARKLVFDYVKNHQEQLKRTWATERPFELYLDGLVVSGRADVIYDEHGGIPENLAIVDYKTATGEEIEPLQLQIYADAGRREGLSVEAAFIEDMGKSVRHTVAVDLLSVSGAEALANGAAERLRSRDFAASPARDKCMHCDVRQLCRDAILR